MRFKLPSGIQSVSVEGQEFKADENGVIDTPDLSLEAQIELTKVVGAVPLSHEELLAEKAEEDERETLYARLGELGMPVDRRRRYPLGTLRSLVEDAEEAKKAAQAPEQQPAADPDASPKTPKGKGK